MINSMIQETIPFHLMFGFEECALVCQLDTVAYLTKKGKGKGNPKKGKGKGWKSRTTANCNVAASTKSKADAT